MTATTLTEQTDQRDEILCALLEMTRHASLANDTRTPSSESTAPR